MPNRTPRSRRARSAAVLVAAALLPVLGIATPAQADPAVDVACTGSEVETFTPGLTLTPRDLTVSFSVQLTGCVTGEPGITTGTIRSRYLARGVSCLQVLSSGTGTETVVWNDGRTSTYGYNLAATSANGTTVAVLTGTVTSGLFAGRAVTRVITSLSPNPLACATTDGVTVKSAAVELTVSSL